MIEIKLLTARFIRKCLRVTLSGGGEMVNRGWLIVNGEDGVSNHH
jgi:hypothetical protein